MTRLLTVAEGVKARYGAKEKNNLPLSKRGLKTQSGTLRMTKADYQAMLEEKGLQNQALSTGLGRFSASHTSLLNKTHGSAAPTGKQDPQKQAKESAFAAPLTVPERKGAETRMMVKAPGKMSELMMPDRPLAGAQIYSNIIGKKIEQRRALTSQREEYSKSSVAQLPDQTSFNSEILRNHFATEVPAGEKRAGLTLPGVRPNRSEKALHPMKRFLAEEAALLGGSQRVQVLKPRDRKLLQLSKPRLDPLDANIFEPH